MSLVELFILAVGLSMDAFAVSICKGLATQKVSLRHYLAVGLWFGGFQTLMPSLGFVLGSTFAAYISRFDHWIACVLLAYIGANMIREALSKEEEEANDSFAFTVMLLLAIATSIDALMVGIAFAVLPSLNLLAAVIFIGCTTFTFSACGIRIGHVFGLKYKRKAEILGGVILICIGLKVLIEHLFF